MSKEPISRLRTLRSVLSGGLGSRTPFSAGRIITYSVRFILCALLPLPSLRSDRHL